MLFPSALPRDALHSSHARLRPSLFSSPARLLAFSSHTSLADIVTTCPSSQSHLWTSAPIIANFNPAPSLTELPTVSLALAASPLKLRLRPRPQRCEPAGPRKVTKRAATRATINKRRVIDDEIDRYSSASGSCSKSPSCHPMTQVMPSTPKHTHITPEQLPLGLDRSDFHNMHLRQGSHLLDEEDSDVEDWSAEDDCVLIEVVLQKLRLSKAEWQDCARNFGRNRHTVARRWKALFLNGDIGLKSRPGH